MTVMRGQVVAGVLVVLIAGCGGGANLAESDPNGYEACSKLAASKSATDAKNQMGGLIDAGESARKASTKAIRNTVKPLFDKDAMGALEGTENEGQNFYIPDADDLEGACSDAGFDF